MGNSLALLSVLGGLISLSALVVGFGVTVINRSKCREAANLALLGLSLLAVSWGLAVLGSIVVARLATVEGIFVLQCVATVMRGGGLLLLVWAVFAGRDDRLGYSDDFHSPQDARALRPDDGKNPFRSP